MLKIHEFLSVASQLAFNAAQIIQATKLSNNLHKQMKGVDDPVTQADIQAQTHILKVLRTYWPTLRIIGEEDQESQTDIQFQPSKLDLYNQKYFEKNKNGEDVNLEYELKDLCCWVDPLDGTLSFVQDEMDAVTTLIGLSYKNKPVAGVIGQPYHKINGQFEFKPLVFFGHTPQQRIFYSTALDQSEPNEFQKPQKEDKKIFATQKNRISEQNLNRTQQLASQVIQIGGAGKKTLLILQGEADYYLYIGKNQSLWDICASEALVNGFGGQVVNLQGGNYIYDPDVQATKCEGGCLVTLHSQNLPALIEITKAYL